jgi:hypothetical protein
LLNFWKSNEKMEDGSISQPAPTCMKWNNPPLGRLKTNWDVALNSDGKRVGIGVIIRDGVCCS